jgi:Sulfatase
MRFPGLVDSHGSFRFDSRVGGPVISTATLAVLSCFLALGLLGLYLKFALMGDHWGAVARFLGKRGPQDLTIAERIGFFAEDLALNMVIVPIVTTAIVSLLFGAYRLVAALAISVVMSVCYFVELRAQDAVGQYLSRDMLRDLASWTASNPGAIRDYVTLASLIKLVGLIAALFGIVVVARTARRAGERTNSLSARRWRTLLAFPAVVVMGAAILLLPICYAYRSSGSLLNESSVGRAAALLVSTGDALGAVSSETFEQALAASRRLTTTAPFDPANPLVGRERGSDLIVFVMETGAAQALDISVEGRDLPGTGPLFERAFVGQRHYTSHPYSSDAVYSALSGMYPQGRRRLIRRAAPGSLNGLFSAVAADTPVRRVYVPSLYQLELDDRMYAVLGAERIYASDEHEADPLRTVAAQRADALIETLNAAGGLDDRSRRLLRDRLVADFQALERMKLDIASAMKLGQRYAVIFFPEIGHGPWIPLRPDGSILARGRALMLLQDVWLKEIVDEVRRGGRLEHTVIALTGDHGVRTQAEDPALTPGTISDYMFRVPLLIYAPNTLSSTVVVSPPTSHIDLTPTLLGLFGATEPAARMQGVPLWQRRSTDRLYLLAFAYGGADGFVQDDTYYMRQALSGAVSRSREFRFSDGEQVAPGDPAIPFVNRGLEELEALQRVLVARQSEQMR